MTQANVEDKPEELQKYQLEWVELKRSIDEQLGPAVESRKEKILRKFTDNPLIPIGCLTTTGFLSYGLYSMVAKDHHMQQYMMRGRVAAQGFTLAVITFSLMGTIALKSKKKAAEEKKAQPGEDKN